MPEKLILEARLVDAEGNTLFHSRIAQPLEASASIADAVARWLEFTMQGLQVHATVNAGLPADRRAGTVISTASRAPGAPRGGQGGGP